MVPLLLALPGCGTAEAIENPDEMKMLVLGMDGMDPKLLARLMDEGKMPNFSRVAARGGFVPLGTSMPPQSPVAWSSFISGARPNTHMIWDFIHRYADPGDKTKLSILPYLSTSEHQPVPVPWYQAIFPEKLPWFGGNQIPLSGGEQTVSLRKGPAFWDALVAHDVDTTIYRLPANFPPAKVKGHGAFRCLCGMGTPDMLGSYGSFTSFRSDVASDKSVAGGAIHRLSLKDNRAVSRLAGPSNAYRTPGQQGKVPDLEAKVEFVVDPDAHTVKITIGDEMAILREGEWSNWLTVKFDSDVPGLSMMTSSQAIVRMYARQVSPILDLYCTPLNIDPAVPFQAISEPPEWAAEIAATTGAQGMYTTGIPEDTKALRSKPQALTEDEFIQMVRILAGERHAQYRHALSEFKRGFLFFYFGHTDQLSHIFWRDIDPQHPGRIPEQEGKYDKVIEQAYLEMDERLAEALAVLDDNDVLIVMSDHGFSSFRRGFNANTWLHQNGYQSWRGTRSRDRALGIANINFRKSQAYAVGLSCLYVNIKGRERDGIVPAQRYESLLHEIGDKLLGVRDDDGAQPIVKIYYVHEEFPDLSEEDMKTAPDMLIGYAANYRGSWATALGGMGAKVLEDNKDRWSGDHCIAHYIVPGVLVTNQKIGVDDPELIDLAPSILKLFGAKAPPDMIGRNIFGAGVVRE